MVWHLSSDAPCDIICLSSHGDENPGSKQPGDGDLTSPHVRWLRESSSTSLACSGVHFNLVPFESVGNLRQSDAHEGEGEAQAVDCDPNIFRMWILTESGQQCSQCTLLQTCLSSTLLLFSLQERAGCSRTEMSYSPALRR
jgi:hypothetical protein